MGPTFGPQKEGQNDDFFERCESEFRLVKNHALLHIGHPRMSKKQELKSMIFQ